MLALCAIAVSSAATLASALADQGSAFRIENESYTRYEWRASTFEASAQEEPAIAVAPDGTIVAVWSSRRQNEGRYGVYAQRFTREGIAIGGETPLALWNGSHQSAPAVAVDGSGCIWAVWSAHGQDGHHGSIIARRFDPSLVGGSEILVNELWRGHQSDPAIAAGRDGRVLIVWTSLAGPKALPELRARLLAADGSPLGGEFAVSAHTSRGESVPSVAISRDGSMAVCYAVSNERRDPLGIRMQLFDRDGIRTREEILVSGPLRNGQIEPTLAATGDGFVVAWLDTESDGSEYGVLARRFDARGNALGEPFVVNQTRAGSQTGAAVAAGPDERFAIAWNSEDGDESGVFARLFRPDGAALGGEFRLSRCVQGPQALRLVSGAQRLVFSPQGALLAAWSGDGGFGDRSAVHVSMLSPRPIELAGRTQGVTHTMVAAGPAQPSETAGPHIPPTFDPNEIDDAEREIVTRGGEIGFTGIVSTGWTPPDPHLAVGPENIALMTNGAIAWFKKDGTKEFQMPIEGGGGFWGELGATGFVFDPEVLYDELSGRFFAMAAEGYAPGNRSYVLIAVSDDSNANGTWYKYRVETTEWAGNLFDSPNIGVDETVVYVTGDGFGRGANYPVYTFDKASMLAGRPIAIQRSTTMPTSTQSAGIPPVMYDSPGCLYMIEHQERSTSTQVRLIALTDPLGTITFTDTLLDVPAYGPPEDPPQRGTAVRPESFDQRFWSCAYRKGSLWATHHINASRVVARWYEIRMNDWPFSGRQPELVQSGNLDGGGSIRTFFSSITVDRNGNAAMCAARSSPDEYISMVTSYRLKSDPPGQMRPMVIRKSSTGPYTSSRWGDYSQVNVDPADGRTFWAHHEWAEGNSWRTWVQGFSSVCVGDLDGDGAVGQSDLALLLSCYGTSDCGDVDGDGDTDQADLALLLSVYGTTCP